MQYSPTSKNKKAFAVTVTFAVIAAISVFASRYTAFAPGILQLIALLSATVSVFFFVRYRAVRYTYIIRPKSSIRNSDDPLIAEELPPNLNLPSTLDFVVERKNGAGAGWAECRVGVDELTDCFDFVPSDKQSRAKRNEITSRGGKTFFYTVTYKPDKLFACVFKASDYGEILVIFEPDERMRSYFLAHVGGK